MLSLEDAEILIERVKAVSACPLKTSTRERKEQKEMEGDGKGKGEKGKRRQSQVGFMVKKEEKGDTWVA